MTVPGSAGSTATQRATAPAPLPAPRGPLTYGLAARLTSAPGSARRLPDVGHPDALGGDLQLALHICYELHYRGWAGVDDDWEWAPELIRFRSELEHRFVDRLRQEVGGGSDVERALGEVASAEVDPASAAGYLRDRGTWQQMREYFAHRSIYHLKEADPLAWAIPRLTGSAKAAFVAVEFDEFGGGDATRMHSRLFGDLLSAADLDTRYLGYLDQAPPQTLATVNMITLFGLHRRWRAALVGHFAAAETSTPPAARALVTALERLRAPAPCLHFYTEHVEADAVHEQLLRTDVVGALLDDEPGLAADVVFGVQATRYVEDRLSEHLLHSWSRGVGSLLPLTGSLDRDPTAG